jgi:hypothetical protein
MIGMNINYTFLRITSKTDLMTSAFYNQYVIAGADGSLLPSNTYCDDARRHVDSPSLDTSITAKASLQCTELELGTSYSDIRRLVVSSVTSSASRTAVRLSSLRSSHVWSSSSPRTRLAMLNEEDNVPEEVLLDTLRPVWDLVGRLDEKLLVEGFSPNAIMNGAGTLDDKMASDDDITLSVSELTILKRSMPFAQGAMRIAFYARTVASDNRYVVKSFKRGGKRMAHLVEACAVKRCAKLLHSNSTLSQTRINPSISSQRLASRAD